MLDFGADDAIELTGADEVLVIVVPLPSESVDIKPPLPELLPAAISTEGR
jgi:hypothetical protein